jgi:hypothetical protein
LGWVGVGFELRFGKRLRQLIVRLLGSGSSDGKQRRGRWSGDGDDGCWGGVNEWDVFVDGGALAVEQRIGEWRVRDGEGVFLLWRG